MKLLKIVEKNIKNFVIYLKVLLLVLVMFKDYYFKTKPKY